VQGEGAAEEIACGIAEINEFKQCDAIIVSRGGGSTEDLWSFNEEVVARAVYNSRIPVISAVGHQVNTSLCDLVADVFVETPTAAAKIIVDKKNLLLAQLAESRHELSFEIAGIISAFKNQVISLRQGLKSPLDRLQEKSQLLDELSASLNSGMRQSLRITAERLRAFIQRLEALSPLGVLSRGYSLSVTYPQGAVVKDAASLSPGERVKTMLGKGAFISKVEEISKD
jgi:exodeoxyribonuclease VII large subunit